MKGSNRKQIFLASISGALSLLAATFPCTAQAPSILEKLDTTALSSKKTSSDYRYSADKIEAAALARILKDPKAAPIADLYKKLLGRNADSSGLGHYLEKLNSGLIDMAGIERSIRNSPEFARRMSGNSGSSSSLAPADPATPVAKPKIGTVTASNLNVRTSPWGDVVSGLPKGAEVEILGSVSSSPDWIKIRHNGSEKFVAAQFVSEKNRSDSSSATAGNNAQSRSSQPVLSGVSSTGSGFESSPRGKDQLRNVVNYALSHHRGGSYGKCFNAVWGYLTSSGYGNLRNWTDLPDMPSGEARNFAEFMNRSQNNRDRAGIRRIDNLTPPITNPHDPRIPNGAVIVVAPGSTGTYHATAGDIVIKAGTSRFVNDGPNMYYGTASSWRGKVLGVYIPK
ncbi:MAG: hypothetical protein CVV64_10945 [Candidatus Wallbacteria bacterium HGW-Wallbacteria-1]|jgi:uncharacterized protein YgiM (DUF1202 family)|uniref:SH3b domain-containing protein n=1 Tax=Candidatus Wallbacteria bacterium HGW-Wallbacteria-1 TaxID=2013854 RepID=A0A2N1PPG8_9BACT|nr:MAG: hypothetical protein CVV64_10945 [Candidatus Wallbacteria bacterium HGW-Wallbacteria-1]